MPRQVAYTFVGRDRFSKTAKKIETSTERVRRKFRRLNDTMRRTGGTASRLGGKLKRSLGGIGGKVGLAGLALGASRAAMSWSDLEKGLVNVLTTLKSQEEVDQHREGLRKVMQDAKALGFVNEEITIGLFKQVSAFGAGEASMKSFKVAQIQAIAGATDLPTAVNGQIKALKAYKGFLDKEGKALVDEDVMNTIFTVAAEAPTTVAAITEQIGTIAGGAKFAGVPLQEALAALGQMTNALTAPRAATALEGILRTFVRPTPEQAQLMRHPAIGLPADVVELRETGLINALGRMAEIAETHPRLLARLVPGEEAFRGIAVMDAEKVAAAKLVLERIKLAGAAGENSDAMRGFSLQMDTQDIKAKRLLGALSNIADFHVEQMAPSIKASLDLMREFSEARLKALEAVEKPGFDRSAFGGPSRDPLHFISDEFFRGGRIAPVPGRQMQDVGDGIKVEVDINAPAGVVSGVRGTRGGKPMDIGVNVVETR